MEDVNKFRKFFSTFSAYMFKFHDLSPQNSETSRTRGNPGYHTAKVVLQTSPTRYGLPASPNAWDSRIWTASADDRRVGMIMYCTHHTHS